jgi:hypothetical protein
MAKTNSNASKRGSSSTVISIGGITLPNSTLPKKVSTTGGIKLPNITPTPLKYANTNTTTDTTATRHLQQLGVIAAKVAEINSNPPAQNIIIVPDSTYQWNLPPHAWSLPVDPNAMHNEVLKSSTDLHSTRRGRIFFAQGYVGPSVQIDPKTGQVSQEFVPSDKYGFQFMWNPETFSQTTSVNMNVTPSESDATAGLTGFVAANSTISFTLRIDRTNDFTCFKGSDLKYKAVTTARGIGAVKDISEFISFYSKGQPVNSSNDFGKNIEKKITDLLKYGTASDLEFLYRSINGSGFTKLGMDTSEIGYLRPSLVRLDLGPQRYLGIISSVGVQHLAFNREMVPIRTDVSITVDLRAGTGYVTAGVAGSTVPTARGGGR